MATTLSASDFSKAIGVFTTFWTKLEKAVYAAGGSADHLLRLSKDESNDAIKQFAELLVRGPATSATWFRFLIRLGHFDYLYGFAERPEEIEGQVFHPVASETELDHPAVRFTTQQVYEKYGDKMADLSELLDYGIRNPETQLEFPIGIVWKDETGQFWYAVLNGGSGRELHVSRDHPSGEWSGSCRFLLRKPAHNATA